MTRRRLAIGVILLYGALIGALIADIAHTAQFLSDDDEPDKMTDGTGTVSD